MFAGTTASCAPLSFVEKPVDRTPPSARISPVACTKVIRGACVSAAESRASAFPASNTVCVARTNIAWSACPLLRSEEHTSELQSRSDLVCRLLLEKKKKTHQDLRTLCQA